MVQLLKQSTAFTFRLGPFVDDTDGKTAETALTLTQADFRLSKAGGAFAQKSDTTSGAHNENGYYTCILNTTDTATLGTLDINVSEAGALPVFKSFMVVPANVYDSLVGGTDLLDVNTAQFGNTVGTFASGRPEVNTTHAAGTAWASGAITAASIAADAIGASELAADAVTEIGTGVLTSLGYTTRTADSGTTSTMVDAALTEASSYWNGMVLFFTSGPNLGLARRITNFSASTDEITVDSAYPSAIAAGHNYLILPLTTQNLTSINNSNGAAVNLHQILVTDFATSYDNTNKMWAVKVSRLDEDEAVIDLDSNIRAAHGQATANFDTITAAIKTKTDFLPSATAGAAGGVFIAGTNAATTVTTSLTTTFTGNLTGSVGSVTGAVGSVTGAVGSVTGSVGSVASGGITSGSFASGAITNTAIATDAIGAAELAADAVAEIADQVWDEVLSGHLTAGTTGAALNGAGSAGDPWTTTLPGAYGAGTAGKILGDNLNATVSSRATQTSVDSLGTNVGANGTGLTAIPWNSAWDAEVQSEAADALTAYGVSTQTSVDGVPAAVWDALLENHETPDTFGYAANQVFNDIGSISGMLDIINDNVEAVPGLVWDELVEDHEIPDSFGDYQEFILNGTINAVTAADQSTAAINRSLQLFSGVLDATGNDTTHVQLYGVDRPDDDLIDYLIVITDADDGTRASRWITDWVDSTNLATLHEALPFTPAESDPYTVTTIRRDVTGGSGPSTEEIANAVWEESTLAHGTANTYGQTVNSIYGNTGAITTDLQLIRGFLSIQTDVVGDTGNDTTHMHLPWLDHQGVSDLLIVFTDATTGQIYPRWVTNWNNSTKLATITPALPVTPAADDPYTLLTFRRDERFQFTVAGEVDANIESVNGTEVVGDGEPGTEWGPA